MRLAPCRDEPAQAENEVCKVQKSPPQGKNGSVWREQLVVRWPWGCAASEHTPKPPAKETLPLCFLGPSSPFCRSFKKILGLHSNCWLRGTCGFSRHTQGTGDLQTRVWAQLPNWNSSWGPACSHPSDPALWAARGMHLAGTFSPFCWQRGKGLCACREQRCNFSSLLHFMHPILILRPLQSFLICSSWARWRNFKVVRHQNMLEGGSTIPSSVQKWVDVALGDEV